MATDLTQFKPASADDLLTELVNAARHAASDVWTAIRNEVQEQLSLIAQIGLNTAVNRDRGMITDKQANHTLQLLETNFSAVLMLIAILPFAIAEAIRKAVFGVINAVVRNYTGIDFGFG